MLNENRFLGTFRGHNTRTISRGFLLQNLTVNPRAMRIIIAKFNEAVMTMQYNVLTACKDSILNVSLVLERNMINASGPVDVMQIFWQLSYIDCHMV
jgi:hypothetical protein